MKTLWSFIDKKCWSRRSKYQAAFLLFGMLAALAGFAFWLIIRNWGFSGPESMICFAGYPMVICWFFVYMYACRHAFHETEK